MINHRLNAVIFTDVKIPSVAGRVTAGFRGILHRDQRGRAGADRKSLRSFIGDSGAGVPACMEREQKPIIIVDESGLDLVLHEVGLAAQLRGHIGYFDRLAVFVRTRVGDFAGLGLPLPLVSNFEEPGYFPVPGVADRLDLVPRIETVGFSDLLENWRTLLCPGLWSKDQHPKK